MGMEEKLTMPEYCDDVRLMLRPGTDFSVDTAYSFVKDSFIDLEVPHFFWHENGHTPVNKG